MGKILVEDALLSACCVVSGTSLKIGNLNFLFWREENVVIQLLNSRLD